MKRFLKQCFNRFLPSPLRDFIKRRLKSKFTWAADTNVIVEEMESALRCTIDNSWSFLAPCACKIDLANFADTLEGRTEIHSILCAARDGGVLFDIGAHSGLVSAVFCAANPRNKVFSFEPSTVLVERLFAIRELNQFGERMCIEATGIGDATRTMEMVLDPAGGFIQTQRFDHTMWAAPKVVQVRLESITDAASRLNVIPQFIKIDIESYEFEAIKGATEFLSRYKPTLFLELHLNYLEQRNVSAKVIVDMLRQCGYAFYTPAGRELKAREVYDSPLSNVHVVAR